jgi:hypothetical protein
MQFLAFFKFSVVNEAGSISPKRKPLGQIENHDVFVMPLLEWPACPALTKPDAGSAGTRRRPQFMG